MAAITGTRMVVMAGQVVVAVVTIPLPGLAELAPKATMEVPGLMATMQAQEEVGQVGQDQTLME